MFVHLSIYYNLFSLIFDIFISSLIIAAPDLDAWSIAKELVPLVSYSAPFVIYHQYLQVIFIFFFILGIDLLQCNSNNQVQMELFVSLQPLAECMHNLQAEKMAISLQISESWLREYQVRLILFVKKFAPRVSYCS